MSVGLGTIEAFLQSVYSKLVTDQRKIVLDQAGLLNVFDRPSLNCKNPVLLAVSKIILGKDGSLATYKKHESPTASDEQLDISKVVTSDLAWSRKSPSEEACHALSSA